MSTRPWGTHGRAQGGSSERRTQSCDYPGHRHLTVCLCPGSVWELQREGANCPDSSVFITRLPRATTAGQYTLQVSNLSLDCVRDCEHCQLTIVAPTRGLLSPPTVPLPSNLKFEFSEDQPEQLPAPEELELHTDGSMSGSGMLLERQASWTSFFGVADAERALKEQLDAVQGRLEGMQRERGALQGERKVKLEAV